MEEILEMVPCSTTGNTFEKVLNLLNGSTFKKTCSGFAALFQEMRVSDEHCRIQRHAVANQHVNVPCLKIGR